MCVLVFVCMSMDIELLLCLYTTDTEKHNPGYVTESWDIYLQ